MTTTPDDNATTWRDLSDLLVPSEVESLESLERDLQRVARASDRSIAAVMLKAARDWATNHVVDAAYADVPVPAGASTDSSGWEQNLQRDGYSRSLVWRSYDDGLDGITVDIDGRQECDGSFTRHVSLWGVEEGGGLTSAVARDVAALLIEAADELDRLSG
jgi:hypothetical protein